MFSEDDVLFEHSPITTPGPISAWMHPHTPRLSHNAPPIQNGIGPVFEPIAVERPCQRQLRFAWMRKIVALWNRFWYVRKG
jgi:hypothetical protein